MVCYGCCCCFAVPVSLWFEFYTVSLYFFHNFKRLSNIQFDPYTAGALHLALQSQAVKILVIMVVMRSSRGCGHLLGVVGGRNIQEEAAGGHRCPKIGLED